MYSALKKLQLNQSINDAGKNIADPLAREQKITALITDQNNCVDYDGEDENDQAKAQEVARLKVLYPDFKLQGIEKIGNLAHNFKNFVRSAIRTLVSVPKLLDLTQLPEFRAISKIKYLEAIEAPTSLISVLTAKFPLRLSSTLFSGQQGEIDISKITLKEIKSVLSQTIENCTTIELTRLVGEYAELEGFLTDPQDIENGKKITALVTMELKKIIEAFKVDCSKLIDGFLLPLEEDLFAQEIIAHHDAIICDLKAAEAEKLATAKLQGMTPFETFVAKMPIHLQCGLKKIVEENASSPELIATIMQHINTTNIRLFVKACDGFNHFLEPIYTTQNVIILASRPELLESMFKLFDLVLRNLPNNLRIKENEQDYFNRLTSLTAEQLIGHVKVFYAIVQAQVFQNKYEPTPPRLLEKGPSTDQRRHAQILKLFELFTAQRNIGLWALSIPDPANAANLLNINRKAPPHVMSIIYELISDPECLSTLLTLITTPNQPLAALVEFIDQSSGCYACEAFKFLPKFLEKVAELNAAAPSSALR